MPERTYTQEELAALFERASEIQAATARRQRTGLTLADLEHVAAEAGLDPAAVRAAAAELDEPRRPLAGRRSGADATHVYAERWVPGALTEEAWEDVVGELRHRYDTDVGKMMGMPDYGTSTTEQIGRTVEWKHTSVSGVETRVLVQPRGEQLRVRASRRVGLASTATESVMYGAMAAMVVGFIAVPVSAAAGAFWVGILLTLLTLLAAVPLIYRLDQGWRQKKHRALETLADDVAAALAAPAAPLARPGEEVEAPAPLAIPTDEYDTAEPVPSRTSARSRTP